MQTDNGQVTYLDAISQALMSEMEADPDVFIIGEDVRDDHGEQRRRGVEDRSQPRGNVRLAPHDQAERDGVVE